MWESSWPTLCWSEKQIFLSRRSAIKTFNGIPLILYTAFAEDFISYFNKYLPMKRIQLTN